MGDLLLFHFRVTNVKLINQKNPINISSNVREPLEISTTPYFFQVPPTTMSWGFPGMLKCRSDKDVVSNTWEPIGFLFRDYISLGSRDIQVQSFDHMTSS